MKPCLLWPLRLLAAKPPVPRMRAALWILVLFAVAVASALFAGSNQGTITLFWPPHRLDFSLNLVLLLLTLVFVTVYAALRALAKLLELPRQARRWRLHQKERAMHGAMLDAMALFMAGRFLRSRKTAQAALAQEDALTHAYVNVPHGRQLRALAHLVSAEDSQALQDYPQRDMHLEQALGYAPEEPDTALDWLNALPQGAARRTLALRIKLKASRLAQRTQDALDTARLLAKHRAFSASAAQSIIGGLATDLLSSTHDPAQLQRTWLSLEPAERALPDLAIHAAQRLTLLGGDTATARQWLLPAWQRMVDKTDPLPDHQALKLVHALESGMEDIDSTWLARIESAAQANPRDMRLQYLAGMACLKRQLWGKAQQLLTQSTQQLKDAGLRRNAWLRLAELAEQRGDMAAATAAWKHAALTS